MENGFTDHIFALPFMEYADSTLCAIGGTQNRFYANNHSNCPTTCCATPNLLAFPLLCSFDKITQNQDFRPTAGRGYAGYILGRESQINILRVEMINHRQQNYYINASG